MAPANSATNGSAGEPRSSAGDAELPQAAVDEHSDTVGERRRVLEVVRDEEGRQRELAQQIVQLRPHLPARVRIERRHRLVEEEHSRFPRERARERDALALTPRQLGRLRPREMLDAAAARAAGPRATAEGDVLLDVQMRKERVLLEHEADRALLRSAVDAAFGIEPDSSPQAIVASRRPSEPRDRAQHGRLAGAGRADERDRLAADFER